MSKLVMLSLVAMLLGGAQAGDYTKTARIPSTDEVAQMKTILTEWIGKDDGGTSRRPHLLRWVFHDAGTWDQHAKNGGAHACMTVTDSLQYGAPPNKGFQEEPIASLLSVYHDNGIEKIVSIPDFFHFASVVMIAISSKEAGEELVIPFYWGRTECKDQGEKYDRYQGYSARLPPPTLFFDGLWENMGLKMGFSWDEIVTLMGGHTLGDMGKHGSYDISLLDGVWTTRDQLFDNEYYRFLNSAKYFPLKTRDSKGVFRVQWGGCFDSSNLEKPNPLDCFDDTTQCKNDDINAFEDGEPCTFITMLRTDLELIADTDDNLCTFGVEFSPYPALTRQCRPQYETIRTVQFFARENTAFLDAFKSVWVKLQSFGGDDLKPARGSSASANNAAIIYGGSGSSSGYPSYGGSGSNQYPSYGGSSSGYPSYGGSSSGYPSYGGSGSNKYPSYGGSSSEYPRYGGSGSNKYSSYGGSSSGYPSNGGSSSGYPSYGAYSSYSKYPGAYGGSDDIVGGVSYGSYAKSYGNGPSNQRQQRGQRRQRSGRNNR
eukprot:gb/GEZN01005138.1/.p1 GENE.gb/GEZN01005138.1/~~gb/GEZN01005138.1/.p1  ORF type:complete len:542 (+),score=24.48 gb/GEZN01005138.1/:67-1692(+)